MSIKIEKVTRYEGTWRDEDNWEYAFHMEPEEQGTSFVVWDNDDLQYSEDPKANEIEEEIISKYYEFIKSEINQKRNE